MGVWKSRIFFYWHCASRKKSDSSAILLLPYLNPLVHCVHSQNKPLFPQNAVYHVRVLLSRTTERKGSWLLNFLAGWKKNCFLLVAKWTKRSLSDVGKMNEPGQLVALLTPDDLQIFTILISIFGPARSKAWIKQWASSYATIAAETISIFLSHQIKGKIRYK